MDRKTNYINSPRNISVVGLGKLGICSAACFSYKGFNVWGVDINKKIVDAINQSRATVSEPRLQELISKSGSRLRATNKIKDAIKKANITFFIVPTPSKKDGAFSDKYLLNVIKPLSIELKNKNRHHIFVITSTVSPGTIDKRIIPLIEKYSMKKVNRGFSVVYNPEFIALGDVVKGVLEPDMVLIGESNKDAGEKVEKIYSRVCDNHPYIARMSIISAEITKIALNSYITMKISFANTLGNISDSIPGAEIDKITTALGSDKRVSPFYIKSGLAYGGPCFPRDNRAFVKFASEHSIDAKLAKVTHQINVLQNKIFGNKVLRLLENKRANKVSIFGLAYKPGTSVIEEAASIKLIEYLFKKRKGLKIYAYDKLAQETTKGYLGTKINHCKSAKVCAESSSIWVIATPENEFKKLLSKNKKGVEIINPWRL